MKKDLSSQNVQSLQMAVEVYRDETSKAKSEAHLFRLELDKARRINDET